MVALNFNAQTVQPSYGGDSGLPDGRHNTVIINTQKVDKNDQFGNVTSSYLEITHAVIDGPLKGQTMKDRLTLLHASAEVVRIANQQLSAYCHVLQVYQFTDTSALHNKPMQIEVGRQLDKTTKQPTAYGEIKKIFDAAGNEAGKAGQQGGQFQQPQHQQPPPNTPPAGGVQADGSGWNQGGQQGGQQQPPPQQQGGGQNWGAPADQGQQQPPQQQGGGWGPPADQGGQQGGQQGGGWAPGAGAGGAPSWGAR